MKKVLKGFSEKKDGSMYSPPTEAIPENIANRKRFFESKELHGRQIALAGAVHGAHVAIVTPASPHIIPQTDALVTRDSDIILALTGADCFPVYFEEKKAGLIGLAHSGWRGIVAGIIGETVETLEKLGGHKDDVVLTIGPGISKSKRTSSLPLPPTPNTSSGRTVCEWIWQASSGHRPRPTV